MSAKMDLHLSWKKMPDGEMCYVTPAGRILNSVGYEFRETEDRRLETWTVEDPVRFENSERALRIARFESQQAAMRFVEMLWK